MILKQQFVYNESCSNKPMQIAGKYLVDVAPSREQAAVNRVALGKQYSTGGWILFLN